jgi:hypothetical protein
VVERCVTALSLTACDSTFPCTVVAQELLLTAAARNCDGRTLSSDDHTLTVEHINNVPRVLDNCGPLFTSMFSPSPSPRSRGEPSLALKRRSGSAWNMNTTL